jgi:hypothetical protein
MISAPAATSARSKVLKSNGFAAYDAKLQAEIQNWLQRSSEVTRGYSSEVTR